MKNLTANDLIETSANNNEISHAKVSAGLRRALRAKAEDSVDAGSVVEYWGTTTVEGERRGWRVHLHREW